MIYELRRYRIQSGYMPAMHERMQHILFPLFETSGVPRPIGIWEATAGAELPLFVWMLRWDGFEQRQAAWGALYPQWSKLRPATVREDEFVLNTSVSLLSAWPELPCRDGSIAGACDEWWIQRVAATQAGLAKSTFLEGDAPNLVKNGASVTAMPCASKLPVKMRKRWRELAAVRE